MDNNKKFEYTFATIRPGGMLSSEIDYESFQQTLNRMGQEGWEAVSGFDLNRFRGETKEIAILMKRCL